MATAEFSGRTKPSLAEQLKSSWIPAKELPEDQVESLGKSLEKAWQNEVKKDGRRQASLARSVYNCFGRSFLIAAFWEIVAKCVFGISVTVALGLLVNDIQNYLVDKGFAGQRAAGQPHAVANISEPKYRDIETVAPTELANNVTLLVPPLQYNESIAVDTNQTTPPAANGTSTSWAWNSNETQIVVKSLFLLVCLCGNIMASQYYLFNSTYVGMKCRLAATYLIYRKALKINLLTMESKTSGQIMNLITNDVNKFDTAFYYIQYVYIAPLQTVVIFTLLATFYMGVIPTLVGLLMVVVYLIVQIYLGTQFGRLRNESTLKTDDRVRAMGELIDSIGIIKMYAWEAYFERQITTMREQELHVLGRVMKLRAINLSLFYGACKLLLMVIFVVYVLMGNKFNEMKVFTALTMTNSMRTYLTLFFPYSVAQLNEMKVSLERIRQFLIQDELSPPPRPPPLTWPVVLSASSAALNPLFGSSDGKSNAADKKQQQMSSSLKAIQEEESVGNKVLDSQPGGQKEAAQEQQAVVSKAIKTPKVDEQQQRQAKIQSDSLMRWRDRRRMSLIMPYANSPQPSRLAQAEPSGRLGETLSDHFRWRSTSSSSAIRKRKRRKRKLGENQQAAAKISQQRAEPAKRADGSCSICSKFDNNHLLIDRKFAIIFHEVSVSWPKAVVQHGSSNLSANVHDSAGSSLNGANQNAPSSALGLSVPVQGQAATSLSTSVAPTPSNVCSSTTTIFNNLTAHIKHHEFVMIVGRVGTGKSSLLMTLLNELPIQSGSIRINGSLSYASQEPWLFAGTIRENITIAWHRQAGRDYKHLPTRLERRYQEILRICCLDRDIQIMPYGDLTQVGERGSALSGGQKARVNLARALFYEADIYLLDDPLAALDSAVAKHIFDECFKTFLKKKTVLLVTHQVQFSTLAQKVLLLHDSPDFSYGPATKVLHNLLERYNLDPRVVANKAATATATTATNEEGKLVPVAVQNENPTLQQLSKRDSLDKQQDLPMGEIETGSLINGSGGVKSLLEDEDLFQSTINSAEDYFRTIDSLTEAQPGAGQKHKSSLSPPQKFPAQPSNELASKSNVARSPSLRLLAEASLAADSDKPADLATYLYYRRHAITVGLLVVFLVANFSTQILFNGTDYFLSEWSSSENTRTKSRDKTQHELPAGDSSSSSRANVTTAAANTTTADSFQYTFASDSILRRLFSGGLKIEHMIGIYVTIIVVLLVASFTRNVIYFNSCLRASHNIHRELLQGVLYAPMKFFDHNSIGTIMSRFSTDLNILDDDISQTLIDVIEISTNVCGIIVVTALVSYYNLLPALVVLLVANYFRRDSSGPITQLKQLETIKRSQVISQAMSTLHGLSTIRVFRLESIINRRFERVQNEHTHIWYSFLTGLHRLTRLIDATCMVYFATLISMTMLLVFNGYVEASLVGLLVSQVIILPGPLQWGARQITELQSLMTSLVRIRDYCKMPSEQEVLSAKLIAQRNIEKTIGQAPSISVAPAAATPAPTRGLVTAATLSLDDLPDNWPSRGSVKFEQVTLSYATGTEILHGISFAVEPGERVGVVGRTGAGKSSVISALFRLTDYKGRILIDEIDTAAIKLNDLRRSISIISQEPVLFVGSVRRNLDPFDEHKDETIWSALEAVRLKNFVLELSGGLEGQVAEGGQNFSLGQRQLICLARVILRKNRILVLDEATANIDPETDLFIQKTIRDYFQNCTVITIAHRLNTIMDSDRILVMEAGQVKEFDEPHLLLANKSSLLAQMIANTGQQQAERLRRIAERTYTRRHQVNL